MGSAGVRPAGPIEPARLMQAVTPDDGCLPNGRAEQVDAMQWQRVGQACDRQGWSSSWRAWSSEDGSLHAHGWPTRDLIESAQAQCIQVLIPPGVKINLWRQQWPAWGWESLWFDFDIREITDQSAASALGHFVHVVATTTGRRVLLSYEGADEAIFARYDPGSDSIAWS